MIYSPAAFPLVASLALFAATSTLAAPALAEDAPAFGGASALLGYAPPASYAASDHGPPIRSGRRPPEVLTERRSTGAMVTGIVLAGLGGAGLATGAALLVFPRHFLCFGPCHDPPISDTRRAAGYGLMAASLVAIGVGTPLIVSGARHVPVKKAQPGDPALAPPPPPPAVEAKLGFGPGQAKLELTF